MTPLLASYCPSFLVKDMDKASSDFNSTVWRLVDDLEQMQHYLLMVKAAAVAFEGSFHENCPLTLAESPFGKEETAQYFLYQFLELDPDAVLEQTMSLIQELSDRLEGSPKRADCHQVSKGNIQISIENIDLGQIQ